MEIMDFENGLHTVIWYDGEEEKDSRDFDNYYSAEAKFDEISLDEFTTRKELWGYDFAGDWALLDERDYDPEDC